MSHRELFRKCPLKLSPPARRKGSLKRTAMSRMSWNMWQWWGEWRIGIWNWAMPQ